MVGWLIVAVKCFCASGIEMKNMIDYSVKTRTIDGRIAHRTFPDFEENEKNA